MHRLLALTIPLALALVACGATGSPGSASVAAPAAGPTATAATAPAARAAAGPLRLARVGTFSSPVYVTGAPGDPSRLFVVEQPGRIRVVRGGATLSTPFLDIRDQVTAGGEQGLLSMAFAPDYATSGRFYVYYTDRDQRQRVVEYRRASADRADAESARTVMVMNDPEPNHNGGQLQFGPDGLLYIGTGDGGGAGDQHGARGNAQNLGSPLGKLLRIDPRAAGGRPYTIPASNPFRTRRGARPEIYAYGLRNPWRFSFDRATGDLAIADVGQNAVEEVDFARRGRARGANFGWRVWEGDRRYTQGERASRPVFPVLTHTHTSGWCSITGGYVVRDRALTGLYGKYVYGDYCGGRVWAATLRPGRARGDHRLALPAVGPISTFGQDAAGRIYVASLNGPVYRITR